MLEDERAVVFDATLLDADGREIVAIDGLAFGRVEDPRPLQAESRPDAAPDAACDERLPGGYLEQSIHADEGLAALDRLLGHEPPAHLLVAPHPLAGWIEAVALAVSVDAPEEASDVDRQLWDLATEAGASERPLGSERGLG
jgi:hypothetical protein